MDIRMPIRLIAYGMAVQREADCQRLFPALDDAPLYVAAMSDLDCRPWPEREPTWDELVERVERGRQAFSELGEDAISVLHERAASILIELMQFGGECDQAAECN